MDSGTVFFGISQLPSNKHSTTFVMLPILFLVVWNRSFYCDWRSCRFVIRPPSWQKLPPNTAGQIHAPGDWAAGGDPFGGTYTASLVWWWLCRWLSGCSVCHHAHSRSGLGCIGRDDLAIGDFAVSETCIRALPPQYNEGSLALGASQIYTIFKLLLPAARSGILTSINYVLPVPSVKTWRSS